MDGICSAVKEMAYHVNLKLQIQRFYILGNKKNTTEEKHKMTPYSSSSKIQIPFPYRFEKTLFWPF